MIDFGWLFIGAWLLVVLGAATWSLFWQILGLWFAAKNGDRGWFLLFLFVNLLGIPEIYYLHHESDWPFS